MPSPLHGNRPPYRLQSNVVHFHDWRYVNPGGYRWSGEDGASFPLFTLDPVPELSLEHRDMPTGLRLVPQRVQKSEPVMEPEGDGEILLMAGCLMHEDGRYRLWYECWPKEHIETSQMGNHNYVRYVESSDGLEWTRPRVGIVEREGSRDNNIVYGGPLVPETGYHGGCIFKDPSAPTAERYKLFHLGCLTPERFERFRKERPDAVDAFVSPQRPHAIFGAVSPDGLQWTPLPDPLVVQNSDTHNVCEYDTATGKYVAYCRSWYFHRRTIGRMETDDFRRFPLPEELFWPGTSMPAHDLWYANGKTLMPGTTDYHLMFPLRWSLPRDRFDFHLATSPDGIVWNMVPGGPVCEPGEPGAWDEGVVWPGVGMVELPGDRMGILFEGSPIPHKHPRRPPLGKLAWASWPRDRLVALEAKDEASFVLWPLVFHGQTVTLNFRAHFSGHIRIEALGADGAVLPGRSFDDCDALSGDQLAEMVTWRGQADLGHSEGEAVTLRFEMRSAELFSVRFGAHA